MKKFNEFLDEAKDDGEYGQQGGMAKSQLRMIMSAAKRLHDSLKDDDVLPGHIIANIVLASDYVTGSADYMESEMDDEEYDDDEMDDMDEAKLAEVSTEKLRDYSSATLQDKNKVKAEEAEGSVKRNREMLATGRISKDEFDRRMGYGKYKKGQPAGVGPLGKSLYKNLTKSAVKEEVELDEEYKVKKAGVKSTIAHPDGKPVHDIIHNGEVIGKIVPYSAYSEKKAPGSRIVSSRKNVTHYSLDFHSGKGPKSHEIAMYSKMGHTSPKSALDAAEKVHSQWKSKNEEVELDEALDLRITKVYNKFPKKATYAVHTSDRKYYKEFDNEAAAKAHHAEKSGK